MYVYIFWSLTIQIVWIIIKSISTNIIVNYDIILKCISYHKTRCRFHTTNFLLLLYRDGSSSFKELLLLLVVAGHKSMDLNSMSRRTEITSKRGLKLIRLWQVSLTVYRPPTSPSPGSCGAAHVLIGFADRKIKL